ncbi:MAG TPA: helix-turn-helix domain-containing protein, partial [Myxococcota bacterium]|nr:helix-turn-helix domain-containing protein [Myxococcota bacterium]
AAVQEGKLRADLYYRLNVIGLHVPPLRERREDIALLARHFAALHARRNGRNIEGIDPTALSALESYPWPGNVRELENALERAVVLSKGETLRLSDLPAPIRAAAGAGEPGTWLSFAVGTPLREVERRMIEETLRVYDGDRLKAASILGIAARTIYRREAEWRGEAEEED